MRVPYADLSAATSALAAVLSAVAAVASAGVGYLQYKATRRPSARQARVASYGHAAAGQATRRQLLVLAGTAILALILTAILVLGVVRTRRQPPFPTTQEQSLLTLVPPPIARSCTRRHPTESGAAVSVRCATHTAAEEVTYTLFTSLRTLRAHVRTRLTTTGVPAGNCGADDIGHSRYNRGSEDKTVGELICFRTDRGERFEWSNDTYLVYAVAQSASRNSGPLFEWWNGAGPERTAPSEAGFPNGNERQTIRHIPPKLRSHCQRQSNPPANARSAIRCVPPSGADQAVYISMRDADGYYRSRVANLRRDKTVRLVRCVGPPETGIGAETQYQIKGTVVGRRVCFRIGGHAWIEWTDVPLELYMYASRDDGRVNTLFKWWLGADSGPVR